MPPIIVPSTAEEILTRFEIPPGPRFVLEKLREAGCEAFLVGGCLRDIILKKKVQDWDIATNASPKKMLKLFKKVIPLGQNHGSMTVVHNQIPYEITSYRSCRKDRRGNTILEDLAHRDFTINALAFDPINRNFNDPFGGEKDLKKKIIRAVGDPMERFGEDPLRILRGLRLAAELGFRLHKDTIKGIPNFANGMEHVSPERIRNELLKILKSDEPSIGIELMRKTGTLAVVFPEILKGYRMKQREKFHAFDVYRHSLVTMDLLPPCPILRLAGLLHDIGKPSTRTKIKGEFRFFGHAEAGEKIADSFLRKFRFSNKDRKRITHLVRHHMLDYRKEWKDSAVKRLLVRLGENHLEDFFLLFEADKKALGKGERRYPQLVHLKERIAEIRTKKEAKKVSDLALNGHQIISLLGIKPGKKVGEILKALLEIVLENPETNTPRKLKAVLETQFMRWN